jgi:hypothetical protein
MVNTHDRGASSPNVEGAPCSCTRTFSQSVHAIVHPNYPSTSPRASSQPRFLGALPRNRRTAPLPGRASLAPTSTPTPRLRLVYPTLRQPWPPLPCCRRSLRATLCSSPCIASTNLRTCIRAARLPCHLASPVRRADTPPWPPANRPQPRIPGNGS